MTIVYDEQWITTEREIKVCDGAIRKYERELRKIEDKHGITKDEFISRNPELSQNNPDFKRWYETYLALQRCKERKKGLEKFLR